MPPTSFADKVKLYEKVRQMMAAKYATENYFGPVEKEYKAYKAIHDKEAEMTRKGYNRIKEK